MSVINTKDYDVTAAFFFSSKTVTRFFFVIPCKGIHMNFVEISH